MDAQTEIELLLGATYLGASQTRFAAYSAHAERVSVCLFDGEAERAIDLERGPGDVWHRIVSGVEPGQRYGLRADGPYEPAAGHRFNRHKLLIDPYARALSGVLTWHPALYGYDVESPDGDLSFSTLDSAPYVPKAVVTGPEPGSEPGGPRHALTDMVIYEAHVRGLTRRHPRVPEAQRGRYRGLAHPAVLEHLTGLGVTAVELMPLAEFIDEQPLIERGLTNYWGYNPLAFLAPTARYAEHDPATELREAVQALKAHGLAVILDVVFNHTCEGDERGPTLSLRGLDNASYYALAEDRRRYLNHTGCGNTLDFGQPAVVELTLAALRHWVRRFGIDGFRFDLATTLGRAGGRFDRDAPLFRALAADPLLKERLLIAEPWDLGPDGYRLGGFPATWAEWNDRFRNTVRRFWKGDPGMLAELGRRLHGSADLSTGRPPAHSINYVASHDGFTLADLVAYAAKHNQANGEDNRDGSDHNHSCNHGVEGATDDPVVLDLRARQVRNMLTTLFFAHGTPMLAAGDELGRTQHGNNNAYCQDNEVSWLDWDAADGDLKDFVAALIAFRRAHPALRQPEHLNGEAAEGGTLPPIAWFRPDGQPCDPGYWENPEHRALTVVYCAPGEDPAGPEDIVALALNASSEPRAMILPPSPAGLGWALALATADDPGPREAVLNLEPRSCALLATAPVGAAPARMEFRMNLDPTQTGNDQALLVELAETVRHRHALPLERAPRKVLYQALAETVMARLAEPWLQTRERVAAAGHRRAYYISLEFLMGRTLGNALLNLDARVEAEQALAALGTKLGELEAEEPDAALGNGGLGRLAACFLDSAATLRLPLDGYGIRYERGLFRQTIEHGDQAEYPESWLAEGNPWEIRRPDRAVRVHFGGRTEFDSEPDGSLRARLVDTEEIVAVPYDTPIPGYRNGHVNTLRLWSAQPLLDFDLKAFNAGKHDKASASRIHAEAISQVLYPDDSHQRGKELRLRQQYFLVSASLQDVLRTWVEQHGAAFDDFAARHCFQLNDTHPVLAIPELMRLLLDEHRLGWDQAWAITEECFAYTNHTLLPEALETWPMEMVDHLLPRLRDIIVEIDRRFGEQIERLFPGEGHRLERLAVIEQNPSPRVRMSHLAMVGSHSVNGVAELHTRLIREHLLKDFYELWPLKFTNKTNGVTQRRWLAHCNPGLSGLITEAIGDRWVTDLAQLEKLVPLADDAGFRERWREVKQVNKQRLAALVAERCDVVFPPEALFDAHVKRIHEYKRQMLNLLHAVHLYQRILDGDTDGMTPRCILIGDKAAAGYHRAKRIIRLAVQIAKRVNGDKRARELLAVAFVPNYNVSAMEVICPGAELSEQISTAGKEASGTGNMKFMMNGALTIGTLDGANIEILDAVGAECFFQFGLTAEEVAKLRENYVPEEIIQRDEHLKRVLDAIQQGSIGGRKSDHYDDLIGSIRSPSDPWCVAADFDGYRRAQQRAAEAYRDSQGWQRMSIINCARSGRFSADRTVDQYASEIWRIGPIEG